MENATWKIIEGDCRDRLDDLPDATAHTIVTSPPYFGLRDYGAGGQIGLEATPDEFAAALVAVFASARRVLRDDGTLWLNLGDSYSGSPRGNKPGDTGKSGLTNPDRQDLVSRGAFDKSRIPGVKPKDLIGVPWLAAFALRADGWYLRSEVIWHKPNPMPESVRDRPTRAHETIFLLTKSPRYYYDADAIREASTPDMKRRAAAGHTRGDGTRDKSRNDGDSAALQAGAVTDKGSNKRTVWTVTPRPFRGAHFATYPPELIEPCVLAGAPARCCASCGAPRQRVTEHVKGYDGSVGHQATCSCDAGDQPGTVLDPFSGAGTTGLVALRHDRSYVGLELNPEYAALSRDRIRADSPLINGAAELA